MRFQRWAGLPCALLLVTTTLAGQDPEPVFDRLRGEWIGEGMLMNRPARFSMTWQLEDGLAVLSFRNGFADTAGHVTPVLHAAALYRTSAARPEGVWLDSRGVRIELAWVASDSGLVVTWTAPTETGRTTYRLRSADRIEVIDEVRSSGEWREFGRASYRRTRP